MHLNAAVYDPWVFRRTSSGVELLLLETSQRKADRYFGGGRFWQIPSGVFERDEPVPLVFERHLARYGLSISAVWAAEHAYTIYNRRFHQVQIITVFAVEADAAATVVRLDADEHSAYEWLSYEEALGRVHYRGLKDGLRSVHEYVTGAANPAAELRLR